MQIDSSAQDTGTTDTGADAHDAAADSPADSPDG
jgi:hypothetical protein